MILAPALLLQTAPPPLAGSVASHDRAFNGPEACLREETELGVRVIVNLPERSCVRFKAPRRYEGVWVNAFEGQQFVEGATGERDARRSRADIWFSSDEQTRDDSAIRCPRQHVCRIVFEGREAVDMSRPVLDGYGHLGAWAGLVLADRIVSIVDLGALGQR